MSKPTIPLDSELAKIFGDNTRIFRAMRELFKQAGDLSPAAIEEALITGGNAGAAANQALDVLERLTQAVELIALMPRTVVTIPDTLADLAPIFEEDQTALKESDIGVKVQAFSANLDIYAANPLTAGELTQLQNIDVITITNVQWAFLGTLDQGLATTSTVTFAQLTTSGKIIVDDTTDATTTSDASIQSDGGIAAKKNIISGGEIIVKPASSFGAALVLESPTTAFSSIVKFKHAGTFFGDIGMVASSGIVTYNAGLTVGFGASHLFKVDTADKLKLDTTAVAGNTAMLLFDVDNGILERVTVGAANSGGAGFKLLRIPN